MLSELYQLARMLADSGIETPLVHPDLDTPGATSTTCIRLLLRAASGAVEIADLALIGKDEVSGTWVLRKGNFRYFPAVKVEQPLLRLNKDDSRWGEMKTLAPELLSALIAEAKNCSELELKLEDVDEQATRILGLDDSSAPTLLPRLKDLCRLFSRFTAERVSAAQALLGAIESQVAKADDGLKRALLELLVGKRTESLGKKTTMGTRVRLFFDLRLTGDPAFSVYTPIMRQAVLRALNGELVTTRAACAITGQHLGLHSGPYPGWSAKPVISKTTPVFSKFSDAPCNLRYGRADSDSFPIGANTIKKLVGALTKISQSPESRAFVHNGKLRRIKSKVSEEQDVLIAFPQYPVAQLSLIDVFVHDQMLDEHVEKRFADVAHATLAALAKAIEPDGVMQYVQIFAIRSISDGQIQLAYSACLRIENFRESIRIWRDSEQNLPPNLKLPLPKSGTNGEYFWARPRLLFPSEISRMLTHWWIRNGIESARLAAPTVGTVLSLFLRQAGVWSDVAELLLETALARGEALVTGLGRLLHQREAGDFGNFVRAVERTGADYALINFVSLLGTLLYLTNSKVEDYMNQAGYQMGQLLAAMDELHRCYCVVVRDGDVPNSLMGNGLLSRAADSPEEALAELCDRSRIYVGWARAAGPKVGATSEIKAAIRSAQEMLRIIQPVVESLNGSTTLALPLTTSEKAHLFLGYLSPVGAEHKTS
jgi:hypothetical protein